MTTINQNFRQTLASLAARIKRHPFVVYLLLILPIIGLTLVVSNWYINRSETHYKQMIAVKDAEIQKMQNAVIVFRTELQKGISIPKITADNDWSANSPDIQSDTRFPTIESFAKYLRALPKTIFFRFEGVMFIAVA